MALHFYLVVLLVVLAIGSNLATSCLYFLNRRIDFASIYLCLVFFSGRLSSGLLNAQHLGIYMCFLLLCFVLADSEMWQTVIIFDLQFAPDCLPGTVLLK